MEKREGKRKEKKKKKGDGKQRRTWRPDEEYDGKKLKNVFFTEEEDEQLMRAVRVHCEEVGQDLEAFLLSAKSHEKMPHGTWVRIALLADIPKRSVQSLVQRLRAMAYGGHKWTEEELQLLLDHACTEVKPSWKQISQMLGVNPLTCRDKFRDLCGGQRIVGRFTDAEDWTMRMAICEMTNSLVPTSNIPWAEVNKFLPHRRYRTIMERWYLQILPRLLAYEDKSGYPIEREVFVRHLLRKLKKSGARSPKELEWTHVNTWWSADMNRKKWQQLSRRVPDDLRHGSFRMHVDYWFQALYCKEHKKRDKKMLKYALAIAERKASAAEDPGYVVPPAPVVEPIAKGKGNLYSRPGTKRMMEGCEEKGKRRALSSSMSPLESPRTCPPMQDLGLSNDLVRAIRSLYDAPVSERRRQLLMRPVRAERSSVPDPRVDDWDKRCFDAPRSRPSSARVGAPPDRSPQGEPQRSKTDKPLRSWSARTRASSSEGIEATEWPRPSERPRPSDELFQRRRRRPASARRVEVCRTPSEEHSAREMKQDRIRDWLRRKEVELAERRRQKRVEENLLRVQQEFEENRRCEHEAELRRERDWRLRLAQLKKQELQMELEHQIFPRSARDVKEATVAVGAHTLAAYSAPCAGRRRCRSARARVTMESWR